MIPFLYVRDELCKGGTDLLIHLLQSDNVKNPFEIHCIKMRILQKLGIILCDMIVIKPVQVDHHISEEVVKPAGRSIDHLPRVIAAYDVALLKHPYREIIILKDRDVPVTTDTEICISLHCHIGADQPVKIKLMENFKLFSPQLDQFRPECSVIEMDGAGTDIIVLIDQVILYHLQPVSLVKRVRIGECKNIPVRHQYHSFSGKPPDRHTVLQSL